MARVTRLDWIAKAGYSARGAVYILFGALALTARSNAAEGKDGVFDAIYDMPGGTLLITLTAIGLLAYGIYRVTCALLDVEGKGTEPKGLFGRSAQLFSGIVHLAMAYTASRFATGGKTDSAGPDGDTTREATRTLLDYDLGNAGLYAVALGFFAAAMWQGVRAIKTDHMKHLASNAPPFACTIGRVGIATRGVVFAAIGYSFIRAAASDNANAAKGMGSAVASLSEVGWLYTFVALGMILFGVFSLIQARYRIVPALDVAQAARSGAAAAAAEVKSHL